MPLCPPYMVALKENDKAASNLLSEVQITLLWGLVILVAVMELFMPVLITLIAPGFERGGSRYHDAITFTRVTLPFLPMISLVALWAAVSNAHDRFLGGAIAPIILNLFFDWWSAHLRARCRAKSFTASSCGAAFRDFSDGLFAKRTEENRQIASMANHPKNNRRKL